MARRTKVKNPKELIYVFCEGESEMRYIEYMKDKFEKVSILQAEKSSIPEAENQFKNNPKLKYKLSELNEIWFFFDVEEYDQSNWNKWMTIIKRLRKKGSPTLKIRLLMTTACVEYWFLLHYNRTALPIKSKSDKERVISRLKGNVSHYKKADRTAIWEIADHYDEAIKNGKWTLDIISTELPIPTTPSPERDAQLFRCGRSFTTVHEAISHLEELSPICHHAR